MPIRKIVTKDLEIPLLDNEDSRDEDRETDPDLEVQTFKIMNSTLGLGFLFGAVAQMVSLYVMTLAYFQAASESITVQSIKELVGKGEVPLALYILCRYWFLIAFILPPLVTIIVQKYRTRSLKIKGGSNLNISIIRSNTESFFECARFQLGMIFGTTCQISVINFYALAKTSGPASLIPYCTVVILSTMFILCLLRTCVEQTCSNVSSMEIILRYDDDDDEENPN